MANKTTKMFALQLVTALGIAGLGNSLVNEASAVDLRALSSSVEDIVNPGQEKDLSADEVVDAAEEQDLNADEIVDAAEENDVSPEELAEAVQEMVAEKNSDAGYDFMSVNIEDKRANIVLNPNTYKAAENAEAYKAVVDYLRSNGYLVSVVL